MRLRSHCRFRVFPAAGNDARRLLTVSAQRVAGQAHAVSAKRVLAENGRHSL